MRERSPLHFYCESLADQIVSTYQDGSGINFIDVRSLPEREKIIHVLGLLLELLFPGYSGVRKVTRENVRSIIHELLVILHRDLKEQIELSLRHECKLKDCPTGNCSDLANMHANELLKRIPAIRQVLKTDVAAAFDGDPAAK